MRPRLLRVDGVADVVSYGGLVREIHVQPSPAKLAAYGLTLEDLEHALAAGLAATPAAASSSAAPSSS